uniref:DUF1409 domain-containing protein n=1 Tax=Oryza sativa subsp. japonica TaxID=39947 RepID=Q53Q01_ORYSJ|nr:Protein of unknown function (DUF1409), putative [Oryza sativa Japonica Group]
MSSSTSPPAVPSAEYAEHLSYLVAIPNLSHANYYFLCPVGNPDPTEFVIGKTNRIPFRLTNPDLGHWRNTFKSWPSLKKTSPEKSWITWFKRMSASKRVHWDEIRIGQAVDLTIANSAKDEPLMAAASYFWSNTINAFLFNQAPMTPTLIDIIMITGLDVTSSANPMSLNTKKQYDFRTKSIGGWHQRRKTKPKKTKLADDLPALDPSIDQALDEKQIEEDVDQAAAEPPPPSSSPVQRISSDCTPSAADSHNVEEEEQPAVPNIPVLADLFSFDIKDYLDEETETDTTSKALAPLSDDVKKTLEDISHRLEASLDNLVTNCGSISARFADIQALLSDELADALTPAVYLEQHRFKLEKAKQRLATIQANRQLVHEEKAKLDLLSDGPIKANIDRLESRKIELLAQLQECNAELDLEHKKLADLSQVVEGQKARLKSAIKNVADLTKSLKVIPGTDAQDAQAIEEVEQIRRKAILAIQSYLSQ